jgi:hypothetical protein
MAASIGGHAAFGRLAVIGNMAAGSGLAAAYTAEDFFGRLSVAPDFAEAYRFNHSNDFTLIWSRCADWLANSLCTASGTRI